ncbi:hypothetical protein NDU88_004494 [Pleurodeles waltl]|uniref:Uncharacterized protein n=1 Tax=Pleurodeles waltl TaxID=8319 RepID=A0AAV7V1D1_PLEWA|nr:hypothetical protein NDU88_004494 [Pleurodeles waltl]
MQKMSHGVKIVVDEISCWKAPTSLGYGKNAFFIKMPLDGPRRDLGASTLCEEEEGALSTLESTQDVSQHPQKLQDLSSTKVQNLVEAAQRKKVPRRRSTTQRVECRRVECWGPGPDIAVGERCRCPREFVRPSGSGQCSESSEVAGTGRMRRCAGSLSLETGR